MIADIDMYRDQFGVELICRTLQATDGGFITSRGYRAAKTRPASSRQLRDAELLGVIEPIHADNYGVYGSRKIWSAMTRQGWRIGRDQVARLMRTAGLTGVIRGRKPRTTTPARVPHGRRDLVERRFRADRPNRLWVADITYVGTTAGFCHTAFITDVFSPKILGWATRATMRTEDLSLEALEHALVSAKGEALGDLIHHSDRGARYVSIRYSERLARAGITGSVGTVGDSHDNALAETVNGLYKAELIHARPAQPSATQVEFQTLSWVDWWNNRRLHEALDYATPAKTETTYHQSRDAALALT